ncbi:hypothetical protein [Aliiglaciecola sp. LCG003]|uniref:hypothetical protein n=1 Tax=Aliiglaciecola sp. LCG003 TaxID=3053655 RepID=UPI0025744C6C|nr:hypothetical protein [Aliiglaciecola sp. LCG003]WJG10683.1 hypothetical protein QR722_06470 [Aliiglaciecola sp. LCG003]
MTTIQTYFYSRLRNVLITTTLLFITSAANAAVLYNGYADIEFNLDSVRHAQGNGNGPGPGPIRNAISSTGSVFEASAISSGAATATYLTELISPNDWAIDEPFFQYSESYGDAGLTGDGTGTSDAFADTEFSIFVENNLNSALIFTFSFFSYVSADVIIDGDLGPFDDGGAYAEIFMADDFTDELLFSSAEVFVGGSMFDSDYIEGNIIFTLAPGESNTIYGNVYSEGYAATVAEPSLLYLFCLGLVGLVRLKRQKTLTAS